MTHYLKPVTTALRGKGLITFLKRINTISKRYGFSPAKVDKALALLAKIVTQYNVKASLPITAVALKRNSAVIQKYQAQGIEFAIHGLVHVDYSQLNLETQLTHFKEARQIFEAANIEVKGFRCPYLRANEYTILALSKTDVRYDSSPSLFWEVDGINATKSYLHALEFYGARPAATHLSTPAIDLQSNLVRIPYCLPDDESLIERLDWASAEEMNTIWPQIFSQIHNDGELFNLGLHPERMVECADALRATLAAAQVEGDSVWHARLDEIAFWWMALYQAEMKISQPQPGQYKFELNTPGEASLLLRAVEAKTATEDWHNGYQLATETPCVVNCQKRPLIGLSSQSSAELNTFLKQQGYLVEISDNADDYSLHLNRTSFSAEDSRKLIEAIESQSLPLIKLGRWPNGKKSALCITGDIDALTLWDYLLRFAGK